jgi:hypothetical protein
VRGIAPIIVAEIAIRITIPSLITAVVGRLLLDFSAAVNVVAILCRHGWKTGSCEQHNDIDGCELLNAFHNCLRL